MAFRPLTMLCKHHHLVLEYFHLPSPRKETLTYWHSPPLPVPQPLGTSALLSAIVDISCPWSLMVLQLVPQGRRGRGPRLDSSDPLCLAWLSLPLVFSGQSSLNTGKEEWWFCHLASCAGMVLLVASVGVPLVLIYHILSLAFIWLT